MSGLRERKKQQTRQRISDIATGLFLERGFEAVSIAEIAELAEVSVNTVYNYFPAKEDLFFDREDEVIQGVPKLIRERRPGQSAAEAVLESMRRQVRGVEPSGILGLRAGSDRFLQVITDSPALSARRMRLMVRMGEALVTTLREETGAAPEDPLPELMAQQIFVLGGVVNGYAAAAAVAGHDPDKIAVALQDRIELWVELQSDAVLNYARR